MNEPKNIEAFKALAKRYETITLKEIKAEALHHTYFAQVVHTLTGKGDYSSCLLCVAVKTESFDHRCNGCVYKYRYACLEDRTYDMMGSAKTPKTLLHAYRRRAEYMKEKFPQYFNK